MNSNPFESNAALVQPGNYIADNLRVIGFLGSGGMSDVYKCHDETLSRDVAVKTLRAGYSEETLRRLQIEGRAVAGLEHPNIVRLYGLRIGANSVPILVMEFVDGVSLSSLLEKEGALGVKRSMKIALQITEGLKAAQKQHVIHRDLKPSNIMIVNAGALDERVKILDFGIAKIQGDISVKATQTGAVIGTPQYMSPEQALGQKCDGRSDQYSLGCVLFEMLCGHPPFKHDSLVEILIAHTKEQAPSLARSMKVAPPAAVQKVVSRLLEKNPDNRYDSMYDAGLAIFAASTQNKLAFSRIIGLALGFVAIAASIVVFNLHGAEHKNVAVQGENNKQDLSSASAELTGKAVEVEDRKKHQLNSPTPSVQLPPTALNEDDRVFLSRPGKYIKGDQLSIYEPELSDAGLAQLVRGRDLHVAIVRKCGHLTSASVKTLANLPLVTLDVATTRIDDYAANDLARLGWVEMLCLKETNVSDKTCQKLANLPHLLQLTLAATQITGEGLIPLSHISSLRILDLEDTKTGGSIHNLVRSKVDDLILNSVKLQQNDFDDGLLKMKQLRALRFDLTAITDEQLLSLRCLKDLDHVAVKDCPILTYEGIVRFHKAMPTCLITQNKESNQFEIWPTINTSLLTGPELVINGDFETGKGPEIDRIYTPETNWIPNWQIHSGQIHWVNKSKVTPASGANSIQLSGYIQQNISTLPGAKYCVRLKVASCPDPDPAEERKEQSLELRIGNRGLRYALPFTQNSATKMGWREYVWLFRATDKESNLQFLNPKDHSALGPYIDAVSVRRVIEK